MRNASIDSPVDDLTYDVITVLHAKAKALEAYDKYIEDAVDDDEAREILEEMKRQDQENVRALKEVLARRLDEELGYESEEDELDEEDLDEDEGEEEEDEEEEALASESDEDLESGEHRGEEVAHVRAEPPPRRGESTHRRGA